MNRRIALVFFAASVVATGPVFAKGKSAKGAAAASAESRERAARKACLAGEYAKGVEILSELFLDTNNPTYLFNQGRCLEQNERYEEAISRFREYLRTGSEDAELAQKHISECEALQKKKNPPAPVAEPVPAAALVPAAAPPSSPEVQPMATVPESAAPYPSRSDGSGLRTAGLAVGGLGIAALAVGVALNLKANSLASSISPPNTYERSTESSRKGYETASWIGYGVGAAALATGAVLYGIGLHRSSSGIALAPLLGPGMVGATTGGTF